MIDVALVSPCKNRLKYLKRCLPSWLQQDLGRQLRLSIFVVDYGCPNKTADWLDESDWTDPLGKRIDVRASRVERDTDAFCLGRARNIGLKAAIAAGADLLAVVDADLELPADFIRRYVAKMIDGNLDLLKTGWPDPGQPGGIGFGSLAMVSPQAMLSLRGYDESFRTYGHDDTEFSWRAEAQGMRVDWLPWGEVVHHCADLTNADRVEFYPEKDLSAGAERNLLRARDTRRPVNVDGWGEL